MAVIRRLTPVAGAALTVSQRSPAVGNRSFVKYVGGSLSGLGAFIAFVRSGIAGVGCLIVVVGSLVAVIRDPIAVLAVIRLIAASVFVVHCLRLAL